MNSQSRGISTVFRLRALQVGIIALPIHVCYFAIFYLGLKTGESFNTLQLLLLVFSLWCYLAYIVLVNDLADRKLDASVGKGTVERGHRLKSSQILLILLILVAANAAAVVFGLHRGIIFDLLWVAAYVLATVYSVPPFSFKERGILGFLADSLIEKPLPVLIVFSFFHYYGAEIVIFPIVAELLDSIFKHQSEDYDIDNKQGIRTFAVVLGKERSRKIVEVIYPLDAIMVTFAFLVVIFEIPEARVITLVILICLLAAMIISVAKLKKTVFRSRTLSWMDPRLIDPPYVVLLNGAFQLLLVLTLGVSLSIHNISYLPLLALYLVSTAPYWFFYARGALIILRNKF